MLSNGIWCQLPKLAVEEEVGKYGGRDGLKVEEQGHLEHRPQLDAIQQEDRAKDPTKDDRPGQLEP